MRRYFLVALLFASLGAGVLVVGSASGPATATRPTTARTDPELQGRHPSAAVAESVDARRRGRTGDVPASS